MAYLSYVVADLEDAGLPVLRADGFGSRGVTLGRLQLTRIRHVLHPDLLQLADPETLHFETRQERSFSGTGIGYKKNQGDNSFKGYRPRKSRLFYLKLQDMQNFRVAWDMKCSASFSIPCYDYGGF